MLPSLNGLLIRLPATSFSAAAGLAGPAFELKPLFPMAAGPPALGVVSKNRQWYAAMLKESTDGANPWDVAHEAVARMTSSAALAGAAPDLIEPDLVQPWMHQDMSAPEVFGAAEECRFDDQNGDWPRRSFEFAWHLGDRFSQLRQARTQASQHGSLVRIVHLDTGYDDKHATFSSDQLDAHLQKNFIEGNDDARDVGVDGVLKSPGHGTGTLSILAGGRFQFTQNGYRFDEELGGAPQARIVPVRIGNSVVQLTTSAVAQGIAYAASLCDDEATRVHVISMSMGGVASAAWADAVNKAFEAGIVFVAAAGNNISAGWFGGFPTRQIVYPARFRRVIAACGVMADGRPYYGLSRGMMQGNWGPEGAMASALAAYTPNIPWARWGCKNIVRMNGAGTSSATPQIAAAVALYIQKHADQLFDVGRYPKPWMRVEAVRQALFLSAAQPSDDTREKLGNGILRAKAALQAPPADRQSLVKTREDEAGFPFLNVLFDAGIAVSGEQEMLKLEATQLVHRWSREDKPNPLEQAVPDPDRPQDDIPPDQVRRFLEAVSEHPQASKKLRARSKTVLDGMARRGGAPSSTRPPKKIPPGKKLSAASETAPVAAIKQAVFEAPLPPYRTLRGYAVDPTLTTQLDTVGIGEITFKVPWEPLKPGPVGEYLEIMDIDPASKSFYEPVDLDDPRLLAQDGLPPSDGVPQFHQQMTYATCSLTINNFELALGRKSLWRPRPAGPGENPHDDSGFVQRLRIYPHALREANAYYSPQKVALLFGYFNAKTTDPREHLPGGRVFTCLSHDIIAHETTHALLDGMHRRFLLPTNPDVRAFHEAFADCVAMLQRFTFPELLAHQIANTRGQLDAQENLLVQLAIQFGRATGKRMALRDAIGHFNKETNTWELRPPDPEEYRTTLRPHERGRILVAAVFEALLSIYRRRTADLIRLASGGTGILRPGAIHPDLVGRLAEEAAKSAQHVLSMIIRALDYCPPTDITFGEYLRAIITADYDLVADDDLNYRVAFVEAFRRRGIFPPDVQSLGVGSLLWRTAEEEDPKPSGVIQEGLRRLRDPGSEHFYAQTRAEIFQLERSMRLELHRWLEKHFASGDVGRRDAEFLGIDAGRGFEVHMARVAYRSRPDGGILPQLLVGLLQKTAKPVDPKAPGGPTMWFEGGSTIIADLREQRVRYCIRKRLSSASRLSAQQSFALADFDSLHATYLGERSLDGDLRERDLLAREQFALLHRET
jgi:hypothetical protein